MTHPFPTRRSSDLVDGQPNGHLVGAAVDEGLAVGDVGEGMAALLQVLHQILLGGHDRRRARRHAEGDADLLQRRLPGCFRRGVPRSEEHTSELQSLMRISYAVFCLKKKKTE